ncbi:MULTISPECIES: SRPBCC family protein [Flavobacterium]|uniref:SRPBCC family protein n=1 Tax=Flavobacterium TaxID=237 RepID=UPI0039189AA6
MNSNLLFDFTVDKEAQTVNVKREFNANLSLVWDAWTKPELLDQWWAPKPYQNKTKSMDFREGGTWLYCMISPENEIHWCKNDYLKIEHQKCYIGFDAFCDENGVTNTEMPRTEWTNVFTEKKDKTLVNISAKYSSLTDLEMVIQMGFKEGFTMGLNQLDALLSSLKP